MRTGTILRSALTARRVARVTVGALLTVHGLVHLLGAAEGLGWADIGALQRPISTVLGGLWLAAAAFVLTAGLAVVAARADWWPLGIVGLALSQTAIATSWSDARAGTVGNVLLAAATVHGFAADGPRSARARYRTLAGATAAAANAVIPAGVGVVTTEQVHRLPEPVADHVIAAGAVGRPPVTGFRARISGRIRGGPDEPWLPFTGEQTNTFTPAWTRVFRIDATRAGLPTDVLHAFIGPHASMSVKVASLLPVVDVDGTAHPELDEAETVTLLNDVVLFAPAALLDAPIEWTAVDAHRARAAFTHEGRTVHADVRFDDTGTLVDFVSADRWRSGPDGRGFVRQVWSTPVDEWTRIGGRTVLRRGRGRWHPPGEAAFDYLEVVVEDITYLPEHPAAIARSTEPATAAGSAELAPAT